MILLPLFIVQHESSLVQISLIPRPYLLTRKKQSGRPSRIFGIARDFMTSLTSQCFKIFATPTHKLLRTQVQRQNFTAVREMLHNN